MIKNIENSTTSTTTTATTTVTTTSTTTISTISTTTTTANPKSTICDVEENEEEEKTICSLMERPVTSVASDETLSLTSSSISKLVTIEESTNESVISNKTTSVNSELQTNATSPTLSLQQQQQQPNPAVLNLWSQSVSSINSIATPVIKVVDDVSLQQISNDTELTHSGGPISTSSPTDSPQERKSSTGSKGKPAKIAPSTTSSKISLNSQLSNSSSGGGRDEDNAQSRVSEPVAVEAFVRGTSIADGASNAATSQTSSEKTAKNTSRLSERAKKKSWYNVIYPNYKSRAEDFKKLFKDVPNDERLIVDYSCALQRDILVQGRLYVSQNYVCFHANIFSWETYVSIKWKEVTAITKEKTALVIPNAISICTANDKYFFATFTARDKSFLMLFRVWQNTLMNKQFSPQEIWRYVHNCYGEELGLTTDDEDYIDPTIEPTDTETELDFTTAIDDSASACMSITSDYNTANTNSSQSINQQLQTSGNSSASSGGGGVRKSRTKSYFFNSGKSSNLNSSTNASASGSDNKTSDGSRKSNKKMKSNAKELTLSSVKPEEQAVAVSLTGGGSGSESKPKATTTAPSNSHAAAAVATTSHDAKRKISKSSRQREEAVSKNTETVPTDVSDSSDSEDNNIPFVATTECTSTHEGRQILHTILPINVETLFSLLFSKSKFLTDFHGMRKSTDLALGEWSTNDEGLQSRVVSVTVQLAASVGPKTSKVTEYQTMRECSKPGELYSIDVNSVNAGIPYADSFSVLMHFCLVRTVDDHTMLSVHAQIKYKKSIWGVVKGFIEKNTWAGLEDFFTALLHALQSETCIPPAKGKGRRPRRGTATQIRPLDDGTMGTAQIKNEAIDTTLLATNSSAHMPQSHLGGIGIAGKPLATHQHQQLQHQQQQLLLQEQNKEHKTKYKGISLFVIFLMCCLLALNVILLIKLWKLEEHIDVDLSRRARMPNFAALKEIPNTNQDWLELLRQQELLHETELRKWHQVLQTAIELLKKVSVVCERIYNDGKLKQEIDDLHYEF